MGGETNITIIIITFISPKYDAMLFWYHDKRFLKGRLTELCPG